VEAALRAGHGAGARIRLGCDGGPESALRLSVDDAISERWADRVLLPAYDPGEWRRVSPGRRPPGGNRWVGRRRGLPGERVGPSLELGRLLESVQAALRTGSRGASVDIALRPAPRPALRFLDALRPTSRAPMPLGRPARIATSAPSAPSPTEPGLLWRAAIDVSWAPVSASEAPGSTLAAIRAAWTALDGRPMTLRKTSFGRRAPFGSLLTEAELPCLFPSGGSVGSDLYSAIDPPDGIPVGRTWGGSTVRLPVESGQGRHFATLGETGMGKSTLLTAVAVRAARLGGVIVLDPLGETAATIREELEASGREVLWIAPGAPNVGANALAGIANALRTDPIRAGRELEDLVHALRRVRAGRYADSSYWGPRLEEMLARAVRAAAFVPGGTLEDAHALLASAGAGRTVLPPEAAPDGRELTARIQSRPDDAEGARRLLFEVVRNPTLAQMLCAREPSVSFGDLVQGRRIVLVSGSASAVGESTARYLLAAYLALVWSALLSRDRLEKTFVLLDEAQWFGHEGLAEMLRLARRRNVHVGVATQSLASLSEEVQEAVRTNVADLVIFRGSPSEARELERVAHGVSAAGLLGLARGEAAVLLGKGESVRWVRSARIPGPTTPRDPGTLGGYRPPEPSSATASGVPVSALWSELASRVGRLAPGELLEVDLQDLRLRGVARDAELRALGGELGRCGAIVDRGRSDAGPRWRLDPAKLAAVLSGRAIPAPPAAADSPQSL